MTNYKMKERSVPLDDSWDVIIAGGGPAGCSAAIASAREGARTLLVEATGALGGMGTMGLVPWFCGFYDQEKMIARGIAEKVLRACHDQTPHLKKRDMKISSYPAAIHAELLKRVYDEFVTQAGATILFQTQVCSVEKSVEDEIETLIVANKSGLTAYRAKVYVDCTGDGDLAAWAGARFEKGDETGQLQPATHCFTISNVDDYAYLNGTQIHFFDPNSPIHKAVRSDKYPLIVELHSCNMQIGPGTYGFNTGHVFDVDNTNPISVSKALIQGRQMAIQYRDAFAEYLPAFANAHLSATGAVLGVRETRRIMGDYILTAEDYLARKSFPDEICRNAYEIDVHSKEKTESRTFKNLDEVKKEIEADSQAYSPGESYGIPYRCLAPVGLKNVLVAGRCISTDRVMNGSVRIMACCLTTGEAAGLAAALAATGSKKDIHSVDTNELRTKLKANGAYLP